MRSGVPTDERLDQGIVGKRQCIEIGDPLDGIGDDPLRALPDQVAHGRRIPLAVDHLRQIDDRSLAFLHHGKIEHGEVAKDPLANARHERTSRHESRIREMPAERLEIARSRVCLAHIERDPDDSRRSRQRRTECVRRQAENVRVHKFHGMAGFPEHRSHRQHPDGRINGHS